MRSKDLMNSIPSSLFMYPFSVHATLLGASVLHIRGGGLPDLLRLQWVVVGTLIRYLLSREDGDVTCKCAVCTDDWEKGDLLPITTLGIICCALPTMTYDALCTLNTQLDASLISANFVDKWNGMLLDHFAIHMITPSYHLCACVSMI